MPLSAQRRSSMTAVRIATPGGRPAASRHVSAAALPPDRLDLARADDRRHHARALGELHELGAPVRAGGGVALLPLDAVGGERVPRRLAVGTRRLDVHDAHAPRVLARELTTDD